MMCFTGIFWQLGGWWRRGRRRGLCCKCVKDEKKKKILLLSLFFGFGWFHTFLLVGFMVRGRGKGEMEAGLTGAIIRLQRMLDLLRCGGMVGGF